MLFPHPALGWSYSSVRPERDSTSIAIDQGTGRGGKPLSIGFQSTPPVFSLDPFAFFIHHAGLEHCRGAFPVKLDPAFDLRLRHFVVAADALGNFAGNRFNIGRHRLSIHRLEPHIISQLLLTLRRDGSLLPNSKRPTYEAVFGDRMIAEAPVPPPFSLRV
jgi:hypothetical protein